MSQKRSTFRSFLLWVVGGLVVLELIWFLGANWALGSDLVIGAINKKPEKLEVLWGSAKTYVPGVIHLEDLSVRGTSKKQQWQVELDRVRVHMALVSLAFKTFKTYDVQGEGLDFALSKKERPRDGEMAAPDSTTSADLEDGDVKDLAVTPDTTAADATPPPEDEISTVQQVEVKKKKSKRPWRIVLRNIHIDGAEKIAVLGYGVSGEGTIEANLALELKGGPLSLDRTKIHLQNAEFRAQGQQAAHDLTLDLDIALAPFVPKKVKGFEVLGSMSGRVAIKGQTNGAGLINQFLSRFKGFEVGSPGGFMDADLRFDQGVLIPESRFKLEAPEGWIRLVDWRVNTALEVGIAVDSTADDGTKLSLSVEDVEVVFEDAEQPALEGANLALLATSPGIDFSEGMENLGDAFDTISVDLTNAVVADITRFPIPSIEDFSLDHGRIVVESNVRSTPELTEGKVNIAGQGIDASLGDVGLVGDLEIDINIESSDPEGREFSLEESVINIDNVTMTRGEKKAKEKDWYAHIKLIDGRLHLSKPGEMAANIEIGMRDTRPIIAVFSQDKSVMKFFKGILNFKDLRGTAKMEMAANTTEIGDLDISSDGLQLKANMRVGQGESSGIMWVKFHGINIGIDMRGDKTDVRFKKPLKWYEEQTASWNGMVVEPGAAASN